MSYTIVNIVIPIFLFVVCYYRRGSRKMQLLPIVYIALISILGFDTVSDYSMYVEFFEDVRYGYVYNQQDFAIGYWFLNKVFSFNKYGFIFVMGISLFLYYFSCYKVFKKFDCVLWGTFFLFLYHCIAQHENIIRQNIAIAIFNFLLCYLYGSEISKKKIVVSVLCVLLAYTFHYTVILGVLLFFFIHFCAKSGIKFNLLPIILFFILFIIIYVFGLFDDLSSRLNLLGYYGEKTLGILAEKYQYSEHGISLGASMSTFLILFLFYLYKSDENIYIVRFATITLLLSFLTIQIGLIHRIYLYYEVIEVVAICISIKYLRNNKLFSLPTLMIVLNIALMFYLEIKSSRNYYSDYTYKTIFSEDCKDGILYVREVHKTGDLNDVTNRDYSYKAY